MIPDLHATYYQGNPCSHNPKQGILFSLATWKIQIFMFHWILKCLSTPYVNVNGV